MLTIGLILFILINLTYFYVSKYYHRLFSLSLFNILFMALLFKSSTTPYLLYLGFTYALYLILVSIKHQKRIVYLTHFSTSIIFLIFQSKIRDANIFISSFFIFQNIWFMTISYREHFRINFFEYFALINFFPIIISGPLIKLSSVKKSILNFGGPKLKQIEKAFLYTAIGIIFKFYISSYFEETLQTRILSNLSSINNIALNILFFFKIYLDFHGYSLIAKGIGLLFGVELPDNFNSPLLSHSPSDFWNRWHKTLNQWVKENIYNPFIVKSHNTFLSLVLSFLFIALWHQLSIKLVFWAILWVIGIYFFKYILAPNVHFLPLKQFLVFIFTSQIIYFYRPTNLNPNNLLLSFHDSLVLIIVLIGILIFDILNDKKEFIHRLLEIKFYWRYLLLSILWILCSFLANNPNMQFYYSRF